MKEVRDRGFRSSYADKFKEREVKDQGQTLTALRHMFLYSNGSDHSIPEPVISMLASCVGHQIQLKGTSIIISKH